MGGKASEPTDYSKLTKVELQALLDERGVVWTSDMLKSELIGLAEGSG